MFTAAEIRNKQANTDSERIERILSKSKVNAITFANEVINKDLQLVGNKKSIEYIFELDCLSNQMILGDAISTIHHAYPVHQITVATGAKRLETIFNHQAIDLLILKEFVQNHGFTVEYKSQFLTEESWSKKTKYKIKGMKMTISWDA